MSDQYLMAHQDYANVPGDVNNLFEKEREEFERMMMIYNGAIREVKTKLQVLNDELSIT